MEDLKCTTLGTCQQGLWPRLSAPFWACCSYRGWLQQRACPSQDHPLSITDQGGDSESGHPAQSQPDLSLHPFLGFAGDYPELTFSTGRPPPASAIREPNRHHAPHRSSSLSWTCQLWKGPWPRAALWKSVLAMTAVQTGRWGLWMGRRWPARQNAVQRECQSIMLLAAGRTGWRCQHPGAEASQRHGSGWAGFRKDGAQGLHFQMEWGLSAPLRQRM